MLDTSVVVEIFKSPSTSKRFKTIMKEIGEEQIFVSMVQLAEVAGWAVRNRVSPKDRTDTVKEFAHVVPLDERVCLDAAGMKYRRREAGYPDFGLLDGIVLATARSIGQTLLTLDEDFAGDEDCRVIS